MTIAIVNSIAVRCECNFITIPLVLKLWMHMCEDSPNIEVHAAIKADILAAKADMYEEYLVHHEYL